MAHEKKVVKYFKDLSSDIMFVTYPSVNQTNWYSDFVFCGEKIHRAAIINKITNKIKLESFTFVLKI